MGAAGRRRRFVVDAQTLRQEVVELTADQAHHLRVMRLSAGDLVVLFDGHGVEAVAEVIDAPGARLRVLSRRTVPEQRLHVCLVQGVPVKLQRMDTIVQQATELGLSRLLPVVCERSKVPAGGGSSLQRRHQRWLRVAETAAKQCGRAALPQIDAPVSLAALRLQELPSPWLLLTEGGGGIECAAVDGAVTLMVGPEGGWSEAEQGDLQAAGAVPVGLGPRTLRADTAGVVALALAQHRWGDLRGAAAGSDDPSDTPP